MRKVHIYAAGAAVFGFAQHFIKKAVPGPVLLLTTVVYFVVLRLVAEKYGKP